MSGPVVTYVGGADRPIIVKYGDRVTHFRMLDATALHLRLGRALAAARADTVDQVPARPDRDRAMTPHQNRYLHALLGELGLRDDDRFPPLSHALGREIGSTKELSATDADRCISYLRDEIAGSTGPEHERTTR